MWVTVFKYNGFEIKTKSPANENELDYIIDHPNFAGKKFSLIQDAIEQIKNPPTA